MAKKEDTSVELVPVDAELEVLADVLSGMSEGEITVADPKQISRDIFMQVASSESEDDLWRELPTWSTKSVIGDAFLIRGGGNIYPSKFTRPDGTKGGFLAARVFNLKTGEEGILNTSAARVAAKIVWYGRHEEHLPVKVKVVSRGETSDGYPIIDLEKLD